MKSIVLISMSLLFMFATTGCKKEAPQSEPGNTGNDEVETAQKGTAPLPLELPTR